MRIPGRVPCVDVVYIGSSYSLASVLIHRTHTVANHCICREPPLGCVVNLDGECWLEHKQTDEDLFALSRDWWSWCC